MNAPGASPTTGYLVWRLSLKWRAAVDRAVGSLGLTHAQYSLLASLYGLSRSGARPIQRELSEFSGLEPMYVSKLARALERGGLVERAGDPADPRATQLALTDRGVEVVTAAIARVAELQEELTAPIGGTASAGNRALVRTLLNLLRDPSDHWSAPMTDRLPVTGQTIGEAQRAIAPLLEGVLAEVGTTFETWVTLNTLATKGPAIERARLAQDLAGGLGAEPAAIDELLAGIEAAGLTQPAGAAVELTPAGTALHGRVREGVARNTARLYAGMDPDDLATTRRVLEEVTLRARTLVAQG